MGYDLDFLHEFCREIGLPAVMVDGTTLQVLLGHDAILCFENGEQPEDCYLAFADTPWHVHEQEISFCNAQGYYITLDILNVLTGLMSGEVLISEQYAEGVLVDRQLIHRDYNDEFQYLRPGERLVMRRAETMADGA